MPGGALLLDFAAAAHLDAPDLAGRRADVEAAFGEAGLVEACLTVGAFNGLTRVADATGIVLDGGTLAATVDLRAELALNDMAGALNTGPVVYEHGRADDPDRGRGPVRRLRHVVIPGSSPLPGHRNVATVSTKSIGCCAR